jgi:predicted CXXCH cytochrome family protein
VLGVAAARAQAPPESSATAGGAAAATAAATGGRCGTCHPAERVQFERSRHAQEDVRCVSCHGGNDQSLDFSVAHGSGFRGKPQRTQISGLCASCHSDQEKMRPYNLPVDQLALYQTSGHGKRLAQGDTRVAVCSDCHRAHDVLPASDPASSVYVLNIPRTCGTCHGDSTLMKPRGRADVYQAYRSSVHARSLFDQSNLRAPTCVSCHGVHGAAPPHVTDVDKVCGRCHTAERRYFLSGPHRAAMAKAGLPECASCHDPHATQPAQPERLASVCAQCHRGQDPRRLRGQKLYTEFQTAAAELEQAEKLTGRAEGVPIATEDYRARLEEARTYLSEALPAAHSVDEAVVAGFTTRARSVAAEVQSEVHGKLGNLTTQKFVLVLFWFYVIVTVFVLRRFRDRQAPGTRRD